MEQIPYEGQLPVEEEIQSKRSPLIHSFPKVRQTFVKPTECSKRNQGNTEIMEMLVSMKKEMEEREIRDGNNNRRSERSFWRLTSEERNNAGNKCSNKEMRNGKKK